MKGSCIIGVVLFSLCSSLGNAAEISQDSIQLNLGTGEIQFNDDPVSLDEFGQRIQESYSVAVNIWADAASGGRENRFPTYSPDTIIQVLESIQESGVEPELVRTSAITVPMRDNSASTDHVRFISESHIEVNNKVLALEQVTPETFKKKRITIWSVDFQEPIGFLAFLNGLKALPEGVSIAGIRCEIRSSVSVEAAIFTVDEKGKEDVLSAPKVSTKAGNEAVLRVVQNASGYKHSQLVDDKYHQDDLANLGSRLIVTPQIIGDDLLVSGVGVLTKMKDRQPVFMDGSIPVASYTCSKVVVPFSCVFKGDVDTVEFDIADVEGRPAKCRLTVRIVDDKGMNRKQREMARRGALGAPPPHKH